MNFATSTRVLNFQDQNLTASICFNGDFYHARITDPPSPLWSLSGLGVDEEAAVDDLIKKLNNQMLLTCLTNQAS